MRRLKKQSSWPQNNTMVKPENHVVYGPCPFYFYHADVRPDNLDIEDWFDPDETYVGKEKTAGKLVKKKPLPTSFGPYWWGWWVGDMPYTSYDSGQTDMSGDNAGENWSGVDTGIGNGDFGGGDFGGCEGKRRLKKQVNSSFEKFADTDNIHEVPQTTSESVFKSLLDRLLKEGYEWFDNKEIGCFGAFGNQVIPLGVDNPIIYLLEEFYLMKDRKKEVVVVEHRYDTEGNIVHSDYQTFPGEIWREIQNKIMSNQYALKDGNTFIYKNTDSYQETKDAVDEEISKRNQQIVK